MFQLNKSYGLWNGDGTAELQNDGFIEAKLGCPVTLTVAYLGAGLERESNRDLAHGVIFAVLGHIKISLHAS